MYSSICQAMSWLAWRRGEKRMLLLRRFSSTTTGTHARAAALNHCVELVRNHDRERFLCNLHAPEAARPGLFAIHAFNLETARIRSSTTTESTALGRFTWWRNALEQAAAGTASNHPVSAALAHAHAEYGLTARFLMQILDARQADLHVRQPSSLEDLLKYAERTAGSLLLLGLECGGCASNDAAERAAAHAGTALGLATLLRGTAAHAAQGCTYLPADVTARHRVSLSQTLRGAPSVELCDAVAEVADEAVAHLLAARSMRSDVPPSARALLLPATVADHILSQLQRHGYSPFAPGAQAPPGVRLQLALLWRKWFKAF